MSAELGQAHWAIFAVTVLLLLAIDLWTLRGRRVESRRLALAWSIAWVAAGLIFGVYVWSVLGGRLAHEYYAAYAMEKGLSLDNLFLFYVVFQSLGVPTKFQHKVLFWGILGAIIFRGVFIFVGVSAVERWEWVTYLFAAILLYAAWQAFRKDPAKQERSSVVEWLSQRLPVRTEVDAGHFITNRNGRAATPLLLALIAIEVTDILFAIDSVPAALSITRNRFVVYSSNVFAILGLRALYLFLAATITNLKYLHYGLAAVLAFAALKLMLNEWLPISPLASIGVILVLIGGAVWASVRAKMKNDRRG